jgi:hypothetical protein
MHAMRMRVPFRPSVAVGNDLFDHQLPNARKLRLPERLRRPDLDLAQSIRISTLNRGFRNRIKVAPMSMQSNIIPSGRARSGNRAGRVVIATSAGLGILALLGMNPIVLALVALGVLGSILLATDRTIKHEPVAMLV